jgi:hypothetical protein
MSGKYHKVMNPHSPYIDRRIAAVLKSDRWNTWVMGTNMEIVRDFNDCLFTNLVKNTFTTSYLKKHPCSDCGAPSQDRCHAPGLKSLWNRTCLDR